MSFGKTNVFICQANKTEHVTLTAIYCLLHINIKNKPCNI